MNCPAGDRSVYNETSHDRTHAAPTGEIIYLVVREPA